MLAAAVAAFVFVRARVRVNVRGGGKEIFPLVLLLRPPLPPPPPSGNDVSDAYHVRARILQVTFIVLSKRHGISHAQSAGRNVAIMQERL